MFRGLINQNNTAGNGSHHPWRQSQQARVQRDNNASICLVCWDDNSAPLVVILHSLLSLTTEKYTLRAPKFVEKQTQLDGSFGYLLKSTPCQDGKRKACGSRRAPKLRTTHAIERRHITQQSPFHSLHCAASLDVCCLFERKKTRCFFPKNGMSTLANSCAARIKN